MTGSRFTDGGYQAPSTDSVPIRRGRPLRAEHWTIGTVSVDLAIVPLEGGRPELYELEYKLNDWQARRSVYVPCMLRGRELAQQAFALTARELDAGRLPDAVVLPPGARLGW